MAVAFLRHASNCFNTLRKSTTTSVVASIIGTDLNMEPLEYETEMLTKLLNNGDHLGKMRPSL